jgi:hypothetical protein
MCVSADAGSAVDSLHSQGSGDGRAGRSSSSSSSSSIIIIIIIIILIILESNTSQHTSQHPHSSPAPPSEGGATPDGAGAGAQKSGVFLESAALAYHGQVGVGVSSLCLSAYMCLWCMMLIGVIVSC